MMMPRFFMYRRFLLVLLQLSLLLAGALWLPVRATQLPISLTAWLKRHDGHVKIRPDGLVLLSNGDMYLPVFPQDPTVNLEPKSIVMSLPAKSALPDLVQFDNNLFLIHLVKTPKGQWTPPKMTYPLPLKEGLIPQDMQLPPGVVLPGELKIILGAIAYTRQPGEPLDTSGFHPVLMASNGKPLPAAGQGAPPNNLYLGEFQGQALRNFDVSSGKVIYESELGCIPSSMQASPDGALLFTTCLNINQLNVLDARSGQLRIQLPTGQKPTAQLYMNSDNTLLIANRFDPFLSLFSNNTLNQENTTAEEGNPLATDTFSTPVPIYLLNPGPTDDSFLMAGGSEVYLVDWSKRHIVQTFKVSSPPSAVAFTPDGILWVVSRSKALLQGFAMRTAELKYAVAVGKKPVDLAVEGGRLFVLSAEDHRIDVVDPVQGIRLTSIELPADSFPRQMLVDPLGRRLFVSTASQGSLLQLNLSSLQLTASWPVKANLLAFVQPLIPAPQAKNEIGPSPIEGIAAAAVNEPDHARRQAAKPSMMGSFWHGVVNILK